MPFLVYNDSQKVEDTLHKKLEQYPSLACKKVHTAEQNVYSCFNIYIKANNPSEQDKKQYEAMINWADAE